MNEKKICETLDEALLSDSEFALGPVSWSAWQKVSKQYDHNHGHHHVHHHSSACDECDEESNDIKTLIEDFFPEIADPTILECPEAAIAKLSDESIKTALCYRDIPFSI